MISTKYNMLYPPLVERVYEEEKRKGAKNFEKAVKTRLHQMFGAYVQGNAHKKTLLLLQELENGKDVKETSAAIMALHASTKERLPHIENFCQFITAHTGQVESILDLGCGFNPFSIPFWNLRNLKVCYAYDIDTRTKDLLNRFFSFINLPPLGKCADLVTETPAENVDLTLMCKLVPVLESQIAGRGFELARLQNTKFLVITYPLKSLCGKEKGMGKNYASQFEKALAGNALGDYMPVEFKEIGNELVYVLEKKARSK
jgi:16S rRNA (guanine(1405)-N(7))-methyltransferase